MSILPDMMPADAMAPEGHMHRKMPIRYGLLGRLFLALDQAAEKRQLRRLDRQTLIDIGLAENDGRATRKAWRLGFDQTRQVFTAGQSGSANDYHSRLLMGLRFQS